MNGDREYKHMVVVDTNAFGAVICNTAGGQPAIFHDTPPAELLAAQLREKQPSANIRVISFQVL